MTKRLRFDLDPAQPAKGNVALVRVERRFDNPHGNGRFDIHAARMYFSPNGRTINDALTEIRNDPRLAVLNTQVVRSTEDTEALWVAWRPAIVDTILEIATARLKLDLDRATHAESDVVSTDRLTLRDLRRRLQAAMTTWRDHQHHMERSREAVLATIADRTQEVAKAKVILEERCEGLKTSARCAATARVLKGAAAALEATLAERRDLKVKAYVRDREGHLGVVRALAEALARFCEGFREEVAAYRKDSDAASASVEQTLEMRRSQWQGVCRALQKKYTDSVHQPLSALLTELRAAPAHALEVSAAALDDMSDPYCIKRCDVAVAELDAVCAHLAKLSVETRKGAEKSTYDDDEMLHARVARDAEAAVANAETSREIDALQLERRSLDEAARRAREHLQSLRQHADALKLQVQPFLLENAANADPRRVAAVTRVVHQRQANLRDDMARTATRLDELEREIAAARQRVPVHARHAEAARLRQVAAMVRNVCQQMRDQFESVQSEEMLRRIVLDQYVQSTRTVHGMTLSVIQRAAGVARAQYGKVETDVNRCMDEIAEASRRVDTLNQARIENHTGVSGEEIAVFSALEEWVAVSNELQASRDLLAHMDNLTDTCTAAITLLHDVTRETHDQ